MENNKHVQKKTGLAKAWTWMKRQGRYLMEDHVEENGKKLEVKEKLKSKEAKGQLNGQISGEESPDKDHSGHEEIIKVREYDIFNIVETEEGHFVALGNNRMSEIMDFATDCEKMIDKRDWKLLFNVIATTSNAVIKSKDIEEKK